MLKKLMMGAALATLVAAPAFAQRPEINPNFTYPYPQTRTHIAPQAARAYDYARGRHAYGMSIDGAAGSHNASNPALTGGGSVGYNNLLIDSIQ